MIRLSEFCDIVGCKLIQEGEFESLWLVGKRRVSDDPVLSFLENERFMSDSLKPHVACVICTEEIYHKLSEKTHTGEGRYNGGICISCNPRGAFFTFHNYLVKETEHYGKTFDTIIGKECDIHPTAIINPSNVIIGNNVTIGANTIIKSNVNIADDVIVMESCVIGAPGFYYYEVNGRRFLAEGAGKVVIDRYAVIHPLVCIQKGMFNTVTHIGENTKIDNNISIGHDVQIGKDCLLPAGITISGNTSIGNDCFLGVGSVTVPGVILGDRVKVSAGGVVIKNIADGGHYSIFPKV